MSSKPRPAARPHVAAPNTPPTSLLEAAQAYRSALDAKRAADTYAERMEADRVIATEMAGDAATAVASAARTVAAAERALLDLAAAIPAPRIADATNAEPPAR